MANFLGFVPEIKTGIILAMSVAVGFISFREVVRRKIAKSVSEENARAENQPVSSNKNLIQ